MGQASEKRLPTSATARAAVHVITESRRRRLLKAVHLVWVFPEFAKLFVRVTDYAGACLIMLSWTEGNQTSTCNKTRRQRSARISSQLLAGFAHVLLLFCSCFARFSSFNKILLGFASFRRTAILGQAARQLTLTLSRTGRLRNLHFQ